MAPNTIENEQRAFTICDFTFRSRQWRPSVVRKIHDATHLKFATVRRVAYHRDYWDAPEELYATLPVVGLLMRFLR